MKERNMRNNEQIEANVSSFHVFLLLLLLKFQLASVMNSMNEK